MSHGLFASTTIPLKTASPLSTSVIPYIHITAASILLLVVVIIGVVAGGNGPLFHSICPYAKTDPSTHARTLYFESEPSNTHLIVYPIIAGAVFLVWVCVQAYAKRGAVEFDPGSGAAALKPAITGLLLIPILYQGGVQCITTLFLNYILCVAVDIIWIMYAVSKRKYKCVYAVLVLITLFKTIFIAIEITRVDKPPILVWAYIITDAATTVIHFGIQLTLSRMSHSSELSSPHHTILLYNIIDSCAVLWFILLSVLSVWAACSPLITTLLSEDYLTRCQSTTTSSTP